MERNGVEELIDKYNEGILSAAEQTQLEQLLEYGEVSLEQLSGAITLDAVLKQMNERSPSFVRMISSTPC